MSGESGGSGRQGIRVDGGDRGVWEKRGRQRGQGVRGDRGRQRRQGVMGDRGDRWSEETGGQGKQGGQERKGSCFLGLIKLLEVSKISVVVVVVSKSRCSNCNKMEMEHSVLSSFFNKPKT